MKNSLVALSVGFLFAIGLGLSGMTEPQKVVGFLDLFGSWDPSLIFVMIGAILVHFLVFKFTKKLNKPLLDTKWHLPTKKEITPALVIGSTLFGIGWGLGGYCPGPALTSLASFEIRPLIFVVSMIAGMYLFRLFDKKFKLQK
ncbi:MAG: YeeE/YedE family protein [Bdellovibrionota bacterium]